MSLGLRARAEWWGQAGWQQSGNSARTNLRRHKIFGTLIEGVRFAADSLVEERVSSEPVSEVGFSGLAIRHDSERFMDDNRSGKGYFGLENGGISVFDLGSSSCYLDPKLLIILSFLP